MDSLGSSQILRLPQPRTFAARDFWERRFGIAGDGGGGGVAVRLCLCGAAVVWFYYEGGGDSIVGTVTQPNPTQNDLFGQNYNHSENLKPSSSKSSTAC